MAPRLRGADVRDVKVKRYNIDLGRHLTVCDGNYLRLTKLMPNLGRHAQDAGFPGDRRTFRVLVGGASPAVVIEVVECSRYTTVVALSQRAVAPDASDSRMDLRVESRMDLRVKVRLYHDARSAEVIEFQGRRRFESAYAYPNREMRQPDEKAQVNRFLAEFLNVCLQHGVAAEGRLACRVGSCRQGYAWRETRHAAQAALKHKPASHKPANHKKEAVDS